MKTNTNFHNDYRNMPKEKLYTIKFKTSDAFILRTIANENILIPIESSNGFENAIITLNETAAFLWKLFSDGITIQEAIEKSLDEYESSIEMIEFSIVQFILENIKYNLLREEN